MLAYEMVTYVGDMTGREQSCKSCNRGGAVGELLTGRAVGELMWFVPVGRAEDASFVAWVTCIVTVASTVV